MSLLDLFRSKKERLNIEDRAKIVSSYKRLRAVARKLNNQMVERFSKEVIFEGGKKLGLLQGKTLVFDSEDESSILMDYCVYDVRRNGCDAIEQYLIDSPPDKDSDESICLRAMQQARYSVFVVEAVERGLGVIARDLVSNDIVLIVDMGFGQTAKPGLVFASRLLFFDGFAATSGALLPMAVLPMDERDAMTKELMAVIAPNKEGYFDPARLIRTCLHLGCSSHVRYQDTGAPLMGSQQRVSHSSLPAQNSRQAKVGRNAVEAARSSNSAV